MKQMSKNEMRSLINQATTEFITKGGTITHGKSPLRNKKAKKSHEEYVEIEVNCLPEALKKYVVEA